jgi:DNA mismatch endonuclease (patch repair protein)
MSDIFCREKRSAIMQRIGPKNSRPEMCVRSLVYSMGFRFRLHRKDLPGCPDLVFPRLHKVIFVHGCFWHGGHKGCKRSGLPSTNAQFWRNKITKNARRDRSNYRKLKLLDWQYLVIWQCQIQREPLDLKTRIHSFLSS